MTVSPEHARIARLAERFAATKRPDISLFIGDDAAQLAPDLIVSTDSAVQDVHFRFDFADEQTLARRATIAALSDLAAMGAEPVAIFSSLILPRDFSDARLDAISAGIALAATETGACVAGGNLAGGGELSITTTVVGRQASPLVRHQAQPGEGIFVTGEPGAAALGLELLLKHQRSPDYFVDAWRCPHAHIDQGIALVGHASSCIDISDGLLQDLDHVCRASKVGARIDLSALPRDDSFDTVAEGIGARGEELRLTGGEAYVLLFTAASSPIEATRIGIIEPELGIRLDRHGVVESWDRRGGFDHFG